MQEPEVSQPEVVENHPPKSNSKLIAGSLIVIVAVVAVGIVARFFSLSQPQFDPNEANKKTALSDQLQQPLIAQAQGFANYVEVPVELKLAVANYSVNQDFSNVENAQAFTFSDQEKALVTKNAFVVRPSYHSEFFPLYESNRYSYVPNFITTDSVLHNYHLMFDYLLKNLEEEKLADELSSLTTRMLDRSLADHQKLTGTEWENAAKRNVGFFAVAKKLIDPTAVPPSLVTNEVNKELEMIEAHQGIANSAVMNIGLAQSDAADALMEDYSQYVPRGHYDKSDQLKAYFKTMMWYGRLSFRMKMSDEVKSATLITLALNESENQKSWNTLYEPINFFVGKSDDITYYQFKEIVSKVYAESATLESLLNENEQNWMNFMVEVDKLEPPQINSMPIFDASIQEDRENEIKGFRFMGQRFTIDAAIFQRLIYREVGDTTQTCANFKPNETNCQAGARCLPSGLDIPAAMGSAEAKQILAAAGETKYACYNENLEKMSQYLTGLDQTIWTQNLYWGWLYQLLPLLETKAEGYPAFMQNQAWARKELNTYLGSWSQLKHDTILYAKQVYAEMGGGPEEKDDRGYVEPNPQVYARVGALITMTSEGLESRGLLSESMKENLTIMKQLVSSLQTISLKELRNESLNTEEHELIRSYGGQLEHFWLEVNKNEPEFKESDRRGYLSENPAAIIADVATDPNGEVLEVGTGDISEIYVVVPIDGKLRVAKGGVYSYYEFNWPLSDRLTDKKWREILRSEQKPEMPSWTEAFIAK
ncbi:MAG TPA: DUF3160 domain-containing protein [Candidatus Woesebacteria bacterium]|nr:DUF3160 domain-containing protein [Candidatus Woesebacteria bacterium]